MLEILYFQVTDPEGWVEFQTLEHHNASLTPKNAEEKKLEKNFVLFRGRLKCVIGFDLLFWCHLIAIGRVRFN